MDLKKWKTAASGTPPLSSDNASDGYPTAGNPGGGVPSTKRGPYWDYMLQQELHAVLTAASITPDKDTLTQLRDAIISLITTQAPVSQIFADPVAITMGRF